MSFWESEGLKFHKTGLRPDNCLPLKKRGIILIGSKESVQVEILALVI
ncbi:hypothetical protein C7475_1011315 [Chitinophaga sp. S165]|nr:hypothetical protein C7475_1011315 [Chitinophaga sp. S165]